MPFMRKRKQVQEKRGADMGKYLSWIIANTEKEPTDVRDAEGNVRYILRYTYECPHCHAQYESSLPSFDFRKCRCCNENVSPYKGKLVHEVWE